MLVDKHLLSVFHGLVPTTLAIMQNRAMFVYLLARSAKRNPGVLNMGLLRGLALCLLLLRFRQLPKTTSQSQAKKFWIALTRSPRTTLLP